MKLFSILIIIVTFTINSQAQSINNAYGREVFYIRENVIKPAKKNFIVLYLFEDSTIYKEANHSLNSALYFIDNNEIKEKTGEGSSLYSFNTTDDELTIKTKDGQTILVMDDTTIRRSADSDKLLYHFTQRPPLWAVVALIHHYAIDKDSTLTQTLNN